MTEPPVTIVQSSDRGCAKLLPALEAAVMSHMSPHQFWHLGVMVCRFWSMLATARFCLALLCAGLAGVAAVEPALDPSRVVYFQYYGDLYATPSNFSGEPSAVSAHWNSPRSFRPLGGSRRAHAGRHLLLEQAWYVCRASRWLSCSLNAVGLPLQPSSAPCATTTWHAPTCT